MKRFMITTLLGIVVSLFAASYTEQAAAQQVRHLLTSPLNLKETREVILATQRNRRLHFFDAATLEPLGHFAVGNLAHTVSPSPNGRTLFIEQAMPSDPNGCCALFALDLETRKMCWLIEPSSLGVITPDSQRLFVQRGNVGIDVFNAETLVRMPTVATPHQYRLYPSPDSRWLFGITTGVNGQGPSLDVFDLKQGAFVRRLPFPKDLPSFEKLRQSTWPWPDGAWLGDHFYLYAHDGKQGNLWSVTPGTTTLSSYIKLSLPDLAGIDQPILHSLRAAGERLFLYEQFGMKIDRRNHGKATGGLFVIESRSGKMIAHLAPSIEFARLIVSPDGRRLYGIDSGPSGWRGPVRLIQLDATSGAVITERTLEDDVWFISLATLPKSLVPNGEVRPTPCQAPEQ